MARYEREFHLKDIRRKDKFIEKLTEIYKHQNIPMRVELLAKDLQLSGPTPELIQSYQVLDYEIVCAIFAAQLNSLEEKTLGMRDRMYSLSPAALSAYTNRSLPALD